MVLLSLLLVLWTLQAAAQEEDTSLATVLNKNALKVCAERWALPFSGSDPAASGISLELAGLIAKRLKVRLEYEWLDSGGRGGLMAPIKRTLRARKCDCYVGLPIRIAEEIDWIDSTEPFLGTSFAMVIPEGAEPIQAFEEVRGKKVGAPGNSPPWKLLYDMGLEMSFGYRRNEDIIDAVEKGELEIGFVWGPTGGWILSQDPDRKVQLIPAHDLLPTLGGEPLVYNIGIAVRRTDVTLKEALWQATSEFIETGKLEEIVNKYGVPYLPPFELVGE